MLIQNEKQIFRNLSNPYKIQSYLDSINYSDEKCYRSPCSVIRDKKAHCYDGAVFAAASFSFIGLKPLIVEMLPNNYDDDHIVAVFKRDNLWGAVAKSNFVGLRYREPVYKNLRELIMSYFEAYYNIKGQRTLRGYTLPLNLSKFNKLRWIENDSVMENIANALDDCKKISIISKKTAKKLSKVDARSFEAGLFGAKSSGLYRP